MDFSQFPVFSYADAAPKLRYVEATFQRQLASGNLEAKRLRQVHRGLPHALRSVLLVGAETWAAVRALASTERHAESAMTVAIATPPLARVLAELVYWLLFLFDSPRENVTKLYRSAWAKTHAGQTDLEGRYGGRPEWKWWLRERRQFCEWLAGYANTGPEDRGKVARVAREWPMPSGIARLVGCSRRERFARFLETAFYGQLSQHIHFTGEAFLATSGILLSDEAHQRKYCSDSVATAFVLYLSLLSEAALDVTRVGHPLALLEEVWRDFAGVFAFGEEVWQERYSSEFAQRRAGL